MKTEEKEHMTVDVLSGSERRHSQIIENAIAEEWAEGFTRIARKEDLIWMKQQRGSDQDEVDIRRLRDDKDREDDQRDQ